MTDAVTHFSMWAVLKSPLILGNDVTSMVRALLPRSPPAQVRD